MPELDYHVLPIYNPTRYLYITTESMQDREATFRILEKHFARYEIHTWTHFPHILITLWTITGDPKALLRAREYRQPPLLEYRPVKKHDRGQYVYLLQPRFVEYRAGVAPRKSLKSLSDSEVRDAIFDDELTRTTPLPHLKGRGRWIFTFYQV